VLWFLGAPNVKQVTGPDVRFLKRRKYEGWNFNSGNYLFTTDTK